MDDLELLEEFARSRSAQAFETLVSRYVDLIYSAALRQVRNPHVAEEVTQAVLIVLMHKAGRLPRNTVLPAWLLKVTRYASMDVMKMDTRRKKHERAAAGARGGSAAAPPSWEQVGPVVDEAIAKLGAADRDVVVLRFLLNQSHEQIAWTLNISEETARQRVSRAIGKLRAIFARRGIATIDEALGAVLAANAVQAAPPAVVGIAKSMAAAGSGALATPPVVIARGATRSLRSARWAWRSLTAVVVVAVAAWLLWPRHMSRRETQPTLPPPVTPSSATVALKLFDYSHIARTRTRLMVAAGRRDRPAVEQFLAAGDDVNAVSNDGTRSTAIMYAAAIENDQNHDVIDRLLRAGGDANTRYNNDYTALMRAVRFRSPRVVQLLLAHGADPLLTNSRGETALDWARQQNSTRLIELLQHVSPGTKATHTSTANQ